MKLKLSALNDNHQTLISLLRRLLLPRGEAGALDGPRGSCRALKNASREARGPGDFLLLEGEGVMHSMTDEVLEVAVGG
jgi:hypothetical protein